MGGGGARGRGGWEGGSSKSVAQALAGADETVAATLESKRLGRRLSLDSRCGSRVGLSQDIEHRIRGSLTSSLALCAAFAERAVVLNARGAFWGEVEAGGEMAGRLWPSRSATSSAALTSGLATGEGVGVDGEIENDSGEGKGVDRFRDEGVDWSRVT